jgi:tRNA nucleotidyltransferase (CCA-adding enzyme)
MKTLTQLIEHAQALETSFAAWAKGPGKTEEEKSDNAVSAIKKAIANDPTLSKRSVSVFAQGSYRNRTNIRAESDVDVCVRCPPRRSTTSSHKR